MFDLLNDISELVYVADMDTYELLYANQKVKQLFRLGELDGRSCYEALQGRNSPCPFCPNPYLKPNKTYTWEHTNDMLHRHYLLKDQLIDWSGRKAHLEIAFDITEVEREKQLLQGALNSEKMMMEIVRRLYQSTKLEDAVGDTLKQLGVFLCAERTYIFEIDGNSVSNTYEWCAPGVSPEIENLQNLDIRILDRWMPHLQKHECVIIKNLEDIRESWPEEYRTIAAQGITSLVAAPLERNGTLTGYIGVDNPPVEKLENISVFLHTLRYFLMSTIQRLEDEQLLKRLSYCDTLTGLYNRNRYIEDIEKLSCFHGSLGVVYLDINGLKDINDRFGHAGGDQTIAGCAGKMKEFFPSHSIYRIGGDEFIILCKDMARQEFEAKCRQLRGIFSIGPCRVAVGSQWESRAQDVDIRLLISCADAKMYEDKKQFYHAYPSSNRYRHHNDTLLNLALPKSLHKEIEEGRFLVYFQPKISLADRKTVGAEALVRYQAPDGTFYIPGQFIALLESARLISQVDFFVFEFSCAKIREWLDKGRRAVPLSVNFSQISLMEPGIIRRLTALCEKYGIEKKWLEIEITETADLLEKQPLSTLIGHMREAGFAISIDDFGTHFFNLTLLTSIEFDELKIDRSLVANIASNTKAQAVMSAVVDVCRKMDIRMIAEGIETEEQLEALRELGFEKAQGYLFSRPVSPEEYDKKYLNT